MAEFTDLPDETIVEIMFFVGFPDVLTGLGRCSRRMVGLSRNDGLWRRLFAYHIPKTVPDSKQPDELSKFKREFLQQTVVSLSDVRRKVRKMVEESGLSADVEKDVSELSQQLLDLIGTDEFGCFVEDGVLRCKSREAARRFQPLIEAAVIKSTRG